MPFIVVNCVGRNPESEDSSSKFQFQNLSTDAENPRPRIYWVLLHTLFSTPLSNSASYSLAPYMQELQFVRSDGDPTLWPHCERSKEGKRWERLQNDHDHFTQYLEKLSARLADLSGRPCELLLHLFWPFSD